MADEGLYIDFGSYEMGPADLRSMAAMGSFWLPAVRRTASQAGLGEDAEFIEVVGALPGALTDVAWQRRWLACWDRLTDAGFSLGVLLRVLFNAARACEQELFAEVGEPRPLHFELCLLFRRGLNAVCCGAMEIKEEIKNLRAGIAGEAAAVHTLQVITASHRRVAVLSVSLVGRDTRSQYSATELQELPSLILERLQSLLRDEDHIFTGREGEWLLLLPDVDSRIPPSLAAAQIERAFVDPLRLPNGRPLSMAVSMGAALVPDHGRDAATAIQAARLARWALKDGGPSFGWFRPQQNAEWQQYVTLVDELRQAIESDLLEYYLQPQLALDSERCIGAELLLRWRRRNGEWVPPPQIVEMAEQNGWRPLLTDCLIRTAMRSAADLEAAGIDVTLSVNLTAGDLLDPDLPELLALRLQSWNLSSRRFMLELTESSMMGDRVQTLGIIERLRELDFRISLDDFGTGYSSLSYLVNLPIHELKVDRSFVIAMFDSEESMRIVRTIIDLAHDLDMVALAEGVDDERQLAQLRQLGCQVGQGFLFAKPMPLAEFIAWFKQRQS